jgi:DNA-binding MarR family transcriptional regulator
MVSKTVAELRTANVLVSEPDPSDGRRALISVHRQARTDIFRARASRSIAPAVRAHLVDGTDADVERILLLLDELAERIIR